MLVDTCQQEVPEILSELMSPDGFVLHSLASLSTIKLSEPQFRVTIYWPNYELIDGIRPTLENHAHDISHFSIIH